MKSATLPATPTTTRIDVRNLDRSAVGDDVIFKRGGKEEAATIARVQQFRSLGGVILTFTNGNEHTIKWGQTVNLARNPGKRPIAAGDRVRDVDATLTMPDGSTLDVSLPMSARIEKAVKLTARQLTEAHYRSAVQFSAGDVTTYGVLTSVSGTALAGMVNIVVDEQPFAVALNKLITILPIDNRVTDMTEEDL